jgi:hypothetical protein
MKREKAIGNHLIKSTFLGSQNIQEVPFEKEEGIF